MNLVYHFIKAQDNCDDLVYATPGAAGIDLPATANFEADDRLWRIPAFGNAVINTGVQVAIPEGCYGQVVMRSGHGFKRNLHCHIGTIDSDYRGVIKVKVFNLSDVPQIIMAGERFAQLIIQRYERVELVRSSSDLSEIDQTERGAGGFGSTGV